MKAKVDAPFVPLNIAVLTVSDTRTLETDTSGQVFANVQCRRFQREYRHLGRNCCFLILFCRVATAQYQGAQTKPCDILCFSTTHNSPPSPDEPLLLAWAGSTKTRVSAQTVGICSSYCGDNVEAEIKGGLYDVAPHTRVPDQQDCSVWSE